MSNPVLDVVGIGNAIVDVIARTDDEFLIAQKMDKGAMILIDAERAEALYAALGPAVQVSGGSAANTIAGIAALGGRAGFIGRVADDEPGRAFTHDIASLGVVCHVPRAADGLPTARSFILVTPDSQRTMNTFLGASTELGEGDLDHGLIASAKVLYLEGYLWDRPSAKQAFLAAMATAHKHNREVALTLSDSFCVDRFRAEFLELVEGSVDILFANEAELKALFQVGSFDEGLQRLRHHVKVAALTRSEKGSVILRDDEVHVVDAEPVHDLVDTTGAGDLYAAGFLAGYTQGWDAYTCGRVASIAAAEVISHMGARPEHDLKALIAAKLG